MPYRDINAETKPEQDVNGEPGEGGQHISVSASAHTVAIPTQVNRLLRNE
jgi:hypothetical protein